MDGCCCSRLWEPAVATLAEARAEEACLSTCSVHGKLIGRAVLPSVHGECFTTAHKVEPGHGIGRLGRSGSDIMRVQEAGGGGACRCRGSMLAAGGAAVWAQLLQALESLQLPGLAPPLFVPVCPSASVLLHADALATRCLGFITLPQLVAVRVAGPFHDTIPLNLPVFHTFLQHGDRQTAGSQAASRCGLHRECPCRRCIDPVPLHTHWRCHCRCCKHSP
mmetsp:Transcript_45284/g.144296  ORF Transcript_45284/g.144296 Transcript_45284/m.144296 type:complete len:221 (-) Transcript_45284:2044-2706(-)